jgi:hypothetical protein
VARKWATSGRNCASGGCFSLKNRTAGSFWKKHSASYAWDRLGGGGRRAGRVFLARTSGCVRATRAGHWAAALGAAGARAEKLGALAWAEATRGPTREEAGTVGRAGGRRERKGAAGVGRLGRKTEGNRDAGHFTFFFYFRKCFPFSFYLLHLI